jgi:hypothetical protein
MACSTAAMNGFAKRWPDTDRINPTARGGEWTAVQVGSILQRVATVTLRQKPTRRSPFAIAIAML